MLNKLKKLYRNWFINRTIKQVTLAYLNNANVDPSDYRTAIYAICFMTGNITTKDRNLFLKQLEGEEIPAEQFLKRWIKT